VADKDDQQTPGAKGPKADEAKIEAEAAEAKAAASEEAAAEEQQAEPPAADASDDAVEDAKDDAAEQEAEAEQAEADGEPAPEDEKAQPAARRPRRGGAAAAGRSAQRSRQRRQPDADVTVRARARYVRTAPRKARLVIDHIRGKDVDQARAILLHTPRAAAQDVLKLLDSAIANAENNHDLVADDLKVGKAYVDEGPTLKRYRPRALGRATRIRKRTSHMTIELVSKE
jgi:ribosomal protein L22